jgi:ferredoxin-NADP reductase
VTVRVVTNEPETPTTRRLRVALDGLSFSYRAGQAASLSAGDGSPTPYSIASAPSETVQHGWLEFLIKVDGSNRFGAIVDTLPPGAPLDVTGPAGGFVLDRVVAGAPILFIAGGTGIAPMRSMIREAIETGQYHSLALVYSNRTPDEFAYLSELQELRAGRRLDLTLTLTGDARDWTHARGRTGAAHLETFIAADTNVFICGPPAMVSELPAALESLGVPRTRIITESW